MTISTGAHVVPIKPASLPQLAAADRGVADSLEAVLSGNARRAYDTQCGSTPVGSRIVR